MLGLTTLGLPFTMVTLFVVVLGLDFVFLVGALLLLDLDFNQPSIYRYKL